METAIKERLAALSRAQQLTRPGLIANEFDIREQATLKGLIAAIFAPYSATGSRGLQRIVITGCDEEIDDRAVTSAALLLHELATNATKYGALSASTGAVHIDCSLREEWLAINWEEHGGPPVNGPPDRQGFGGNLARRIVENQFRGRYFNEWKPSGLSIRIEIPREVIAPPKAESSTVQPVECTPS
jgi:two-component system CheB/CheR fusion protein